MDPIMPEPDITIIVPVYNGETYLARCLDSVVKAANNHSVELILIDDGSTDSSLSIAKDYSKNFPWIKIIQQENQGPSCARNVGLDHAQGEYIAFIDADDTIDTWYFDFVFENAVNKNLDALIFGHKRMMLDGLVIERNNVSAKYTREDLWQAQLRTTEHRNIYWYTCARIYSSSLIGKSRFDPAVIIGEDPIFNIECLNKANFMLVMPDCPYNYYETPNSLTSSKYKPSLFESIEAHYSARVRAHIWPDIPNEKKILLSDFARSYVEHMLPYLLNNLAYLTIDERYKELVRIRNSFLYETCIENYDGYHPARGIRSLIKYFSQRRYLATLILLQIFWTKQKVGNYV